MAFSSVKHIEMNDGRLIPSLGLGTWLMKDEAAETAVREAIRLGYRHIDTAQAYGNERGVGRGIAQSATGVRRGDIFLTTKLAAEIKDYKTACESIDASLARLGTDYVDLMIIHSPQPWAKVNQSDDRYEEGNREAWRALEDACLAGKIKTIGVSNFLEHDIENILSCCRIRPAVDQVLAHIGNTPFGLIDYCRRNGIVVEAYSPVAHGEALKNAEIARIAGKYGVSVPRLCVKYCLELGMVALPKTENPAHMADNADLDFGISRDDLEALKSAGSFRDYGEHSRFPVFGGKL